jgi:hypothetical protein
MSDKATMTLNLRRREMDVVEQLAVEMDVSKTVVVRQALKLYQQVHLRLKAGETLHFSGDQERIALFVAPGFGEASDE